MKRLTKLFGYTSDDQLFDYINASFRNKITTFDWFVNWSKVFNNVKCIEQELNILNYLIGKENIKEEITNIIIKYPNVVRAFPCLIASRDSSFDVLVDVHNLISRKYDFTVKIPDRKQADDLADFLILSGVSDILMDRKIKNLVDYVTGVEVGLDTNGRKNRSGELMESMVDDFIKTFCEKSDAQYIAQATSVKIKKAWNLEVDMDKSSRIIDFAILKDSKLYLIEVNFYGGGGSKLKSTATEYCEMYDRYHRQGLDFIWITDGMGWENTKKPLREYFDKTDYLVNLSMLTNDVLTKIIG